MARERTTLALHQHRVPVEDRLGTWQDRLRGDRDRIDTLKPTAVETGEARWEYTSAMRSRVRAGWSGVRHGLVVAVIGYVLGGAFVTTPGPARAREDAAAPAVQSGSPVAPPVTRSAPPATAGRSAPASAHWVTVNGSPVDAGSALGVPILMYHRIVDPASAGRSLPELVVPPRLFLAQMTTLWNAGWRTIDTATLAADLATGTRPPPRRFVISFDDGYVDGYTEAYPILKRLGFVATFYVVTGRLGRPDQLTPDELKEMAAAGMEIGDHTVDHVDLATLSDRRLRHEIVDARNAILRTVGEAPVSFAYPFGDVNPRVVAAVAAAGFEIAVTNREGIDETWANRFIVPRLRVGPGTSPDVLLGELSRSATSS